MILYFNVHIIKYDMSIDVFYEVVSLKKYAILCGSAPRGFTQKKINEMYDFLTSSSGGAWAEKEIVFFPNGVDDAMLAFVLERLKADKAEQILLYIMPILKTVADRIIQLPCLTTANHFAWKFLLSFFLKLECTNLTGLW